MLLSTLACAVIVLCLLCAWCVFTRKKNIRLPPGPPPLPLIGNVHQLSLNDPWKKFSEWHEIYGPVICFQVGPFPVIVVGSSEASHELFDKRGRIYNSRPQLKYITRLTGGFPPGLMPYNRKLKAHRQIYQAMLSSTASRKYWQHQDLGTRRLLYEMLESDKPSSVLARFAPNLISLLAYGEPIRDWAVHQRIEQLTVAGLEGLAMGGALVDVIPMLDWLPRILAPWKMRAERSLTATLGAFSANAGAALQREGWSWTQAIRAMKQAEGMSWEQFSYTTGELFQAGFFTTSLTLGVFQMVCATQLAAARHAAHELVRVLGTGRLPQMEDLTWLPYVCAFTKEMLRWRPVTPLGMPHLVTEDDEYRGYRIPANTLVIGNIWAMQMESAVFHEPATFRPERWIENPNLSLALFGFGRRIFPGQHVAGDMITITVARLLWAFEITSDDVDGVDTTKSTLPGIAFRAPDLNVRFQIRTPKHEETIRHALSDIQ